MKTTFELIQEYFNSNLYDDEEKIVVDYTLNGTTIKIQYKKYVEWITKDGRDESWWDYDNYVEVELLDYITFLFNLKKNNKLIMSK